MPARSTRTTTTTSTSRRSRASTTCARRMPTTCTARTPPTGAPRQRRVRRPSYRRPLRPTVDQCAEDKSMDRLSHSRSPQASCCTVDACIADVWRWRPLLSLYCRRSWSAASATCPPLPCYGRVSCRPAVGPRRGGAEEAPLRLLRLVGRLWARAEGVPKRPLFGGYVPLHARFALVGRSALRRGPSYPPLRPHVGLSGTRRGPLYPPPLRGTP